jgi:hypothetical protein
VRQEINGKQSHIGVIVGGDLNILGTLPTAIGKFSITATYRQRQADGLEPVLLEVHMPGDDDDKPSAQAEVLIDEMILRLAPPAPDVDDPIIGLSMGFEFNPLEIKQEGRIQVSAVKAGKRYRLGSLRVLSRPMPPIPGGTPETKEAAN